MTKQTQHPPRQKKKNLAWKHKVKNILNLLWGKMLIDFLIFLKSVRLYKSVGFYTLSLSSQADFSLFQFAFNIMGALRNLL